MVVFVLPIGRFRQDEARRPLLEYYLNVVVWLDRPKSCHEAKQPPPKWSLAGVGWLHLGRVNHILVTNSSNYREGYTSLQRFVNPQKKIMAIFVQT